MAIHNSQDLSPPNPQVSAALAGDELTRMVTFNSLAGPEGRVPWCGAWSGGSQVHSHQDLRPLYSRRSCKYLGSVSP